MPDLPAPAVLKGLLVCWVSVRYVESLSAERSLGHQLPWLEPLKQSGSGGGSRTPHVLSPGPLSPSRAPLPPGPRSRKEQGSDSSDTQAGSFSSDNLSPKLP